MTGLSSFFVAVLCLLACQLRLYSVNAQAPPGKKIITPLVITALYVSQTILRVTFIRDEFIYVSSCAGCGCVLACIRYCRSYRENGNIESYGRDNHIWSNNVRSLCIAADGYHPQMVVLLHIINLGTFIAL